MAALPGPRSRRIGPTSQRSTYGARLFGAVVLVALGAGCELIANIDRSKIEGSGGATSSASASGSGGAGAATSGASSGGGAGGSTSGASTSSSSSSSSASSSSSSSSAGADAGGSGGGVPVMCKDAAKDCPATHTSCAAPTCDVKGLCTVEFTAKGAACSDDGGSLCDGSGDCVACNVGADCPAPKTSCVLDTCISNVCGAENASAGAPCSDGGGALCDGDGSCAQCLTDKDCPHFPSDVCQTNHCVPASCTDMKEDGDETDVDCGGSCAPCADASSCAVDSDCTSGFCASLLCEPCAQDTDCSSGRFCDATNDGGTCTDTHENGTACSSKDQCTSGFCVDGVCCDEACTGTCMACSNAKKGGGADGACGDVKAGTDPRDDCADEGASSCKNDGACDGGGACRDYAAGTVCGAATCSNGTFTNVSTCDGAGTCVAGAQKGCAPYLCSGAACGASCVMDIDCASNAYCDGTNRCVVKQGIGAACVAIDQCASGFCVDGVCCASSCAGLCLACSAAKTGGPDGVCGFVAAGTDPDDECADEGAASCGEDGACDGLGACEDYPDGTECAPPSCANGELTAASTCAAPNDCIVGPTSACAGGLKCQDTTSCLATCVIDDDCQSSNDYCDSGNCSARQAVGATCSAADECANGECVDGYCCDASCAGVCLACDVPGFEGTCSNELAGVADPGCAGEVCDGVGSGPTACVECVSDAQCASPTPACDVATNTCVGCVDDTTCSAPTPSCDAATKTCVQCTSDADCPIASTCTSETCVAPPSCAAILASNPTFPSGVYIVDPSGSGPSFPVYCDMTTLGGGWTLLYAFHVANRSPTEWALTWSATVDDGLNFSAPDDAATTTDYLMPLKLWTSFSTLLLESDTSGEIELDDFGIDPSDNYRWSWSPTGNPGMDYENHQMLSTVDVDNDTDPMESCAQISESFGWYGFCCDLCMTSNSNGSWQSGTSIPPFGPVDWNYKGTNTLIFLGK